MRAKILFADGEPAMRQVVKLSLELRGRDDGVEVTTVCDGNEAVAKIRAGEEFDILIMDYQMPPASIGGIWAAQQIRALKQPAPVVIVFLSAFTRQSHVDAAEQTGALAYISKDAILEGDVANRLLKQDWAGLQQQTGVYRGKLWVFAANIPQGEGGDDEEPR